MRESTKIATVLTCTRYCARLFSVGMVATMPTDIHKSVENCMTFCYTVNRDLARQTIENGWVSEYIKRFPPLDVHHQRHPRYVERAHLILDQATGVYGPARSLRDIGTEMGISKERVRQLLFAALDMGEWMQDERIRTSKKLVASISEENQKLVPLTN